jgi:hypothetical protein
MALRGIYDRLEDAPEGLREHLVHKENKYVLDVEGYATKEVLDEFRGTNRELKRTNEKLVKDFEGLQAQFGDLQARYKDVDPEEYRTLKASPTDVQKQIAEAEGRIKHTYEQTYGAKFAEYETRAKEAEQRLHTEKIKTEIANEALSKPQLGVRKTSLRNLQRDALEVFQIIDDRPVPTRNGEPLYSEKSPSQYMSMEEWITAQASVNPDYFENSSGGGATGGLNGRTVNGRRVIAASDTRAWNANLKEIAEGKVEVDMNA